MLHSVHWTVIQAAAGLSLWICLFIAAYFFLSALPSRRRRWSFGRLRESLTADELPPVLSTLLLLPRKSSVIYEFKRLLVGCGWNAGVEQYFIAKRLITIFLCCAGALGFFLFERGHPVPIVLMASALAGSLCLLFDRNILEVVSAKRKERITEEVYAVSNQLLYYEGSALNVHGKLVRCVPFTRVIRNELQLLINEWYHDAELAVSQFINRIGTEEGRSFGETIGSLRLHESDRYYELLRQRIADYKEKIDLARESKKETASYLLFVIAGIPILNTFRVFIYPWVTEGQRLFESLG